jgi:hypothetical protein
MLDLRKFKQAKQLFLKVSDEYRESNRPMAARSLYKAATCIVFGSDSDTHPNKFDISLFREAAMKANEFNEELEEQGIWVQIAEIENVKKPVIIIIIIIIIYIYISLKNSFKDLNIQFFFIGTRSN